MRLRLVTLNGTAVTLTRVLPSARAVALRNPIQNDQATFDHLNSKAKNEISERLSQDDWSENEENLSRDYSVLSKQPCRVII